MESEMENVRTEMRSRPSTDDDQTSHLPSSWEQIEFMRNNERPFGYLDVEVVALMGFISNRIFRVFLRARGYHGGRSIPQIGRSIQRLSGTWKF